MFSFKGELNELSPDTHHKTSVLDSSFDSTHGGQVVLVERRVRLEN